MGSKVESKASSTFKSITSRHSVIRSRTSMRELNASGFREKQAKIKITLERCENLKPFFQFSDIQAKCVFGDTVIGESTPIPITDAQSIPIMYTFEFQIRRTYIKDMDNLVTFPAFLYFYQIQGTYDRHIYPQLQNNELIHTVIPVKSFDSIISLYEALVSKNNAETIVTGDGPTVKRKSKIMVKIPGVSRSSSNKDSDKMGGKPKKESKTLIPKEKRSSSKTSINAKKISDISLRQSNESVVQILPCEPIIFGMCTIDFLPLLFGNKHMSQSVLIKPVVEYEDEKMNSYKSHPKATITLWTEDNLEVPDSAILNFTVETIYNIPQTLMKDNQEFKLCCMMPTLNEQKVPMIFSNPVFLRKTTHCIKKCWPGIPRISSDANTSEYRTAEDLKDLNVKFDPNVVSYINMDNLRLQFAMIKRHLLSRDSLDDIATHVKAHKKFVLEFCMTTKGAQPDVKSPKNHEPAVNQKKGTSFNPYLHLMALIDLSPLLYPGVRRVRVATPLTTFSAEDAAKYGGLEESYFFPSPKDNSKPNKVPGETERTTKEEKVTKGAEENMKYKLPFRPEEAVDPVQVYDEEGRPCFVVVEIVLTTPLTPKKDIEVLTEELSKLIVATNQVPQELSKDILTSCVTVDYYKEILNGMVNDLNKKYLTYLEEQSSSTVECSEKKIESFVQYLKRRGVYESYVNSISKAVSLLINKKFQLGDNKNETQYQKLIGDVFVFLISQMNETVNKLICHGMEPVSDVTQINNNLFYAKEAMEIGRVDMAQRYLLERICHDTENADYWFDYGIFLLRNKEDDKAFESFKEALTKNASHKYCLLILGALLCDKSQVDDAETCLLVLMNKEFSWLEGWGVLYLFYLKCDNFEGMDMAMDMAKKHSIRTPNEQDEFMEADELVWTKAICPGTIFFRTAVLLLKCRLYEWCELALSQEVNNNSGLVQYLLSVISYYKKLYDHALDHIEETKRIYGPDYAVASLAGHCFLALGRKEEAKEQYYWALEFFNRPVSMPLVSIQLAHILNEFGEIQEARKLALISCKYNPTPYTWMLAGKFYLEQNDLLSAEECFCEGNSIDNRFAEIWGYLALVNAKLKRVSEAEICYNQALRNKLQQQDLINAILHEVGTLSKEDFLHVY